MGARPDRTLHTGAGMDNAGNTSVFSGETGTTAAPSSQSDGNIETRGVALADLWITNSGSGSVTIKIWKWSDVVKRWNVDIDFGTRGSMVIGAGDAVCPQLRVVGADRNYIQITSNSGALTVDVTLSQDNS